MLQKIKELYAVGAPLLVVGYLADVPDSCTLRGRPPEPYHDAFLRMRLRSEKGPSQYEDRLIFVDVFCAGAWLRRAGGANP